jgi:hypothetical protein
MSAARLLVHGVLRAADAAGLGAETVAFGDLAAVVSCDLEDASDDAERSLALAKRHHETLCEITLSRDVLPIRLGAVFADADAVAKGLAELSDLFRARLAVCAEGVEMSLVAEDVGAPPAATVAAGGRDYLKARAAALTEARARPARLAQALDALEAELKPHARAVERRTAPPPRLRDLALLVQRGATVAVSNIVERRQAEFASMGLALALRGPWPVYSFASLSPASLS